jgi:peptidyl-prolyl cis-trans isomerase B (cyclophilin B)
MSIGRRSFIVGGLAVWLTGTAMVAAGPGAAGGQEPESQTSSAPPLLQVETSKGTFSIVTFLDEAPTTVAHIVKLARAGFYDGQRIHRAVPGFVVQFGDPQTRRLEARAMWGRGSAAGSGQPIGAAEISKRRTHRKGAVGVAHLGEPARGDSQLYITLDDRHDLDGKYAVFGQIVEGGAVPALLAVGDEIIKVSVR